MSKYPFSDYPDRLWDYEYKIDPVQDIITKIQQYQTLFNNGQYEEAIQFLNNNPQIRQATIRASDFNKLADGIKSLQEFYLVEARNVLQQLMQYKGLWNSSVLYREGDFVYNTQSNDTQYGYICIQNIPDDNEGIALDNTNYWCKVTVKGDPGLGLSLKYDYQQDEKYVPDDVIIYNNLMWRCVKECTNIKPDDDANNYDSNTNTGVYWVVLNYFTGDTMRITAADETSIKDYIDSMKDYVDTVLSEKVFPIGSIYTLSELSGDLKSYYDAWKNSTDPTGNTKKSYYIQFMQTLQNYPNKVLGFGEWELIEEKFLLASGVEDLDIDGSLSITNPNTVFFGQEGGSKNAVNVSHTHYPYLATTEYEGKGETAGVKTNWGFATYERATNDSDLVARRFVKSTGGEQNTGTETNRYVFAGRAKGTGQQNSGLHWAQKLSSAGESGTNKNMPPYVGVYMWKRIA